MAGRKQMNLYFWRSRAGTAEEKAGRERHISAFAERGTPLPPLL